MKNSLACGLSFYLICIPTQIFVPFNFAVWNVGQGSWSTYIKKEECFHFDMGGENVDNKKVRALCERKKNWILITHLDWDHISFIRSYSRKVKNVCLFYPKLKTKKWLTKIDSCPLLPAFIKILSLGSDDDKNSGSIIYLLQNQVLITGDAPIKEEHKWYKKVPRNIKLLLLGHHGSYTSTSVKLLDWTRPQKAISSARKDKYGHPHIKVRKKLLQRRIPILQTEFLGHLYFHLQHVP